MVYRLTALALWLGVSMATQPAAHFPDPDAFAKRVREALRVDYELQERFSYLERRRDVKVSRLGKVTVGPLRTFEVYPSDRPGGTYKRLIAVEGKPLGASELALRDAEHQRDLRREAERERAETAQQRANRARKEEEERRNREAIFDDVVAVYAPTFIGYESVDGRRVLVADLNPREDAQVATREGRWMKHFAGRIWVDALDHQIVRLEMQAFDDIAIGWGIVGRLHKGSRLRLVRTRFQDVWVPAETTYAARGRTLLFRPFEFEATTTFSDYKRR